MFEIPKEIKTEVNEELNENAWKRKILKSINVILAGALLFSGALYLLYHSEGRVDIGQKVKEATVINHLKVDIHPRRHEKLVTLTGQLKIDGILEDEFLEVSNYLVLRRHVEHFVWVENEDGTYTKQWSDEIPDHHLFKEAEGHENLLSQETLEGALMSSNETRIAHYRLDPAVLNFPLFTPLYFNEKEITPPKSVNPVGFERTENHYFFKGRDFNQPNIGDIRVYYTGVKGGGIVTILGKMDLINEEIVPFYAERGVKLYHIFNGTREEFIESAKSNYTLITWILRSAGFLAMWLALFLIIHPIAKATNSLPFFQNNSKKEILAFCFLGALIICVTSTMIFFSFWDISAFFATMTTSMGVLVLLIKKKAKKERTKKKKAVIEQKVYSMENSAIKAMKEQIIEVLKENPDLSHKEAKKMAESASIAEEVFEDAWNSVNHRARKFVRKVLPTLVILIVIAFSVRVGIQHKETLYDLVYDIKEDAKVKITKILPTPMPAWAKDLGLYHPLGLKLNKDRIILTSATNADEGFFSLRFIYKGEQETVLNEAKKMARRLELPTSKLGGVPLIGEGFAQYGNINERLGEYKEYSILIIATGSQLTLKVTNENQLAARQGRQKKMM